MTNLRVGIICAGLLFLLDDIPGRAQQGGIGASIEGSVVDSSGLRSPMQM